jgi:hypothetical protein
MYYPIAPEEIRKNLKIEITEKESELQALKGVKINTKHKTLTNAAISGKGARIGDYLSIGKALYVSYVVDHSASGGSGRKYMTRDITAYSYFDEKGHEIGSNGMVRISRTLTPTELFEVLRDVKDSIEMALRGLKSEYRRADSIARKHNTLIQKINEFNDSLSYAGQARI